MLFGYSFGAMIAASIAGDGGLAVLVLVSPPLGVAPLPELDAALPVLLVTGDLDGVSPAEAVRAAVTGSLTLDGSAITAADFTVDMTTLKSDEDNRDPADRAPRDHGGPRRSRPRRS